MQDRPHTSVVGSAVGRLRAGARSELRRQLREVQRLRRATLVVVVLLVLLAYPSYLVLQAATRDPAINSLNTLALPGWAARDAHDMEFGSRWCIRECRSRERTLRSERGPDETAKVYQQVLADAGWDRWQVQACPENPVPGSYTCWKRDEYTLDLWVRDPPCAFDPVRNRPTVAPAGGASTGPASAAPASAPAQDCSGSVITIKVRNGISDDRGRGPAPTPENPGDLDGLLPTPAPPSGAGG
ncbi:MAG TPA: hypothetical protein VFE14_08505 [Micromonosporaceae bacterium]|jgi:hypothetical protein|nr:hypothetical protein [Micromonosporaceae bacterium]